MAQFAAREPSELKKKFGVSDNEFLLPRLQFDRA